MPKPLKRKPAPTAAEANNMPKARTAAQIRPRRNSPPLPVTAIWTLAKAGNQKTTAISAMAAACDGRMSKGDPSARAEIKTTPAARAAIAANTISSNRNRMLICSLLSCGVPLIRNWLKQRVRRCQSRRLLAGLLSEHKLRHNHGQCDKRCYQSERSQTIAARKRPGSAEIQ